MIFRQSDSLYLLYHICKDDILCWLEAWEGGGCGPSPPEPEPERRVVAGEGPRCQWPGHNNIMWHLPTFRHSSSVTGDGVTWATPVMDVRCRDIVGGGAELCDCVWRDLPPPSDSDTPCIHRSIPGGSVSRVLTSEGSQPAADTSLCWITVMCLFALSGAGPGHCASTLIKLWFSLRLFKENVYILRHECKQKLKKVSFKLDKIFSNFKHFVLW